MGLDGGAWAFVLSTGTYSLLLLVYTCVRDARRAARRHPQYTWPGFSWRALEGWGSYLHYAVPAAAMICMEWWIFECVIFMAGGAGGSASKWAQAGCQGGRRRQPPILLTLEYMYAHGRHMAMLMLTLPPHSPTSPHLQAPLASSRMSRLPSWVSAAIGLTVPRGLSVVCSRLGYPPLPETLSTPFAPVMPTPRPTLTILSPLLLPSLAPGLSFHITSWTYMIPMSLGTAANTRVANALGAGSPASARRSAIVALLTAVATQLAISATLFLGRHSIARVFTQEEQVRAGGQG